MSNLENMNMTKYSEHQGTTATAAHWLVEGQLMTYQQLLALVAARLASVQGVRHG